MHAARARPSGWPMGPMGRPPTCFYPDGSPDFYAVPCASEGESHCCRNSSGICLSNGHCMDYLQPFAIWRGSCTDETWGSANCPKVCAGMWSVPYYVKSCSKDYCGLIHNLYYTAGDYLDKDVRLSVWRANLSNTQYCCGDADTAQINSSLACIDGSPPFTLPDATPLLGVAGLANAREASSTNSTSETYSTATPSVITTTSRADCSSQKKDTITVGSVLGAALIAVAIALIVWAVWERRQKVLWWQRAIGLAPEWPPRHATWMRAPTQNSKPPPCPFTRAALAYAAHQQQKREQEAGQPAPTYETRQPGCGQLDHQQPASQTQISSPLRPREMSDGMPAAAEMDAT